MPKAYLSRRSLSKSLFALPFALAAQSQLVPPSPGVAKVAAGADRSNNVIKLPGGDPVYVKVSTRDSQGALFMTEQPITRRAAGPPQHYHEAQDDWFYCLPESTWWRSATNVSGLPQVIPCWGRGVCRTHLFTTAPARVVSSWHSPPQKILNSFFATWRVVVSTLAAARLQIKRKRAESMES